MMRFLAVAGSSCLAIRSLIVFLTHPNQSYLAVRFVDFR